MQTLRQEDSRAIWVDSQMLRGPTFGVWNLVVRRDAQVPYPVPCVASDLSPLQVSSTSQTVVRMKWGHRDCVHAAVSAQCGLWWQELGGDPFASTDRPGGAEAHSPAPLDLAQVSWQ